MKIEHKMIYQDKEYTILSAEQEFIIHPIAMGYLPYSSASMQCDFAGSFHVKDYKLSLSCLEIGSDEARNLGGVHIEEYAQRYHFTDLPVSYNGAILIGTNIVKEYYLDGTKPAYFSYQKVVELVFDKGVLITTVDQSRAMLRIRKNLELGLRDLSNKRDKRCINRFMNSVLVGDYKPFLFHYNRMKNVKDMKKDYSAAGMHKFISSVE
jgi:hypothetical protein